MKKRFLAAALLAAAAASTEQASAQEAPALQWKAVDWPLFYLVQNGYRIVAVTPGSSSLDAVYIVQKDNSVFKCPDPRAGDARQKQAAAAFHCYELIDPAAAKGKWNAVSRHCVAYNETTITTEAEGVMVESMTVSWLGIVVLLLAAILVASHYRRERHRNQQFRWLDTHPVKDWTHRRH
jgi:hypothetical protein